MARLLVAGLLMAVATPLLAQPAPLPAPAPMAHPMMMGMAKTMTRAEVQAQVQAQFSRRDANRDGFLTADELAMRGGMTMVMRRGGPMGEAGPGRAMRDPNAAFDRLDVNHDGNISRAEFASGREMRMGHRVVIKRQGEPGAMAMEQGRMGGHMGGMRKMGHGGGMMGAAMLKRADSNRDGKVSMAEATGTALRHFDMMDSNRDGRLTPEERAAGRAQMKAMRTAG